MFHENTPRFYLEKVSQEKGQIDYRTDRNKRQNIEYMIWGLDETCWRRRPSRGKQFVTKNTLEKLTSPTKQPQGSLWLGYSQEDILREFPIKFRSLWLLNNFIPHMIINVLKHSPLDFPVDTEY